MSFYRVNTMPLANDDFAFVESAPSGVEEIAYRMAVGRTISADYPDDARIYFERRHPGVMLPDLVGNTRSYLLVSGSVQRRMAAVVATPTEYLPVALYNHKKRIASADYFVVNPLGTFDCLDIARSDIKWVGGDVVRIQKYVLDPAKMTAAPDLFRIEHDPRTYVISRRLAAALRPPAPSNFFVFPLEQ